MLLVLSPSPLITLSPTLKNWNQNIPCSKQVDNSGEHNNNCVIYTYSTWKP